MDDKNILIVNSEAGEIVHDNSQWHPGFSAFGSVPQITPTGTTPPALQTAVQAAAVTPTDQDLGTEEGTEDESEDEADEEIDEIDDLDDAFDEDALDESADADISAFGEAILENFGATSTGVSSHTLEAAEVEQSMSDEDSILLDEYSDLPELEEIPVADQINHQVTEGNE